MTFFVHFLKNLRHFLKNLRHFLPISSIVTRRLTLLKYKFSKINHFNFKLKV